MLYKHSFNILCGHLNLNQKRKKIKFDRLPIKPAGKPIKTAGIPVRTGWTAPFEFHRFRPVTGQTELVYQYQSPGVTGDRSENKTLTATRRRRPAQVWTAERRRRFDSLINRSRSLAAGTGDDFRVVAYDRWDHSRDRRCQWRVSRELDHLV